MKKTFFSFFLLFIFLISFRCASASALPYFGGLDVAVIPCTCSAGLNWHFFAPLYRSITPANTIAGAPDIAVPGPLVAPTTPTTFSNYVLHPGAWSIGTQVPGAGVCLIGSPPNCVPLTNYGLITAFTGESH